MADNQMESSDQRLETALGTLLIAGITAAASIVLAGGVVYLVRHGAVAPDYHVFRGESSDLRGLRGILREVAAVRGRGLIQLGLLLLIATPVARVAFCLMVFVRRRDFLYSIFTLIVLSVLLFSLVGSRF